MKRFLAVVLLVGMLFTQSVPRALAATVCDQAQFVSDLTVPDGAVFAPGAGFTKTWRFANAGTCAWTTSYSLVFVGGDAMGAPPPIKLPVNVAPGQMLDVSVNLTAPSTGGRYKSLWKFANASGVQFGIGDSASDAFWVDINVVENKSVIYDFVANAPYAQWKSGAGALPFPGTSGDSRGFAYQLANPHLEDDSIDSSPGLLTVPQNKYNGYIQATYPEFQVQSGDTLQTLVNCEFGATSCYVTFRIDYLTSTGVQRTLWSWKEANDRRFYRASISLNSLAGQNVRFVFMLLATGFASGDRAIWGSPRIVRTGMTQPPAPPPTLTLLPPLTPTATPLTPPPPTVAPSGCDRASFVTDVTVQDGTVFSPGAAFTKTWRLKNAGSCMWTTVYKLTFYTGDQMSAPTSVNLPWNAGFDQTVDISVNMVAPNTAGKYRGYWILTNPGGQFFGIGSSANEPIWAEINVAGDNPIGTGYDFTANVCSAEWKSGAGFLPCPGTDKDSRGFVLKLDAPTLEDGSTGAPGLLTFPQNRYNGYLQGFYPTFTVQPGDRFQANVGCERGSSCYVTFRLDYMTANGYIGTVWQWREQNEGRYYSANVDLTPLVGRSVRFILTMLATGFATNDRALWSAPRIVRVGGTPATPTPTSPTNTPAPPTSTPTPTGVPGVLVPSPNIRQLSMIDSSNGWAVGDSYLLRTYDGGSTWYNVLPEVTTIRGTYFPNASTGWVITPGALYRTTNGGANWTWFDNAPFNGGSLQFLDINTGYVLEITGAAMNKQSVILYKTTNGGVTWTQIYNNDPTMGGSGTSLPLGGHKNGMIFRNATTGWIGGDIPTSGFIYLYKTTNGGTTWAVQPLAVPAGYESAAVSTTAPTFFGANDAVLPVWMSIGVGMRDLFIYTTHDGGNTWTRSTSFARQGWNADFVSVNDGFTWNAGGYLQVTHNAGGSWSQVASNVNFGDYIPNLDFVSTTTGWALLFDFNTGLSTLYRTTDGGVTWTLISGPPPVAPSSTPTPDPAVIAQSLVDALNARNFDSVRAAMDQTFATGYWGSQGTSSTPDQAIEAFRSFYLGATPLTSDSAKDLTALLGGLNPYSIMGLDPAKSYALFVSGLGSDGRSEAIFYITRRADGSPYFYGMLFAPGGFIQSAPTPTPTATSAALMGPYAVANVAANDVLNIRAGAGANQTIIGYYPPDATDVMRTGATASADGAAWVEVRRGDGLTGWVNSFYLTEYVTHDAFCADSRILPLIEQARQSMAQANGSVLSPLVSPVHGVNMHLWAYGPGINFTQSSAANIYTDATAYNWGGGPSGTPDVGTFNDVVKPKYLDVLNAPNRETYCDDLTKVFPLSVPWPYPNIHFYNFYKPPSSPQAFDFRSLLVGVEYINGQPYLYGMVTIIWEP